MHPTMQLYIQKSTTIILNVLFNFSPDPEGSFLALFALQ